MLTISSIGVAPRPSLTPVVSVQPIVSTTSNTQAKASKTVDPKNTGVPVAGAQNGEFGVQTAVLPSALPPVDAAQEAQKANVQLTKLPDINDVQAARKALQESNARFKGQLPVEPKTPAQERLDTKINELIPNVWKASAAAVNVILDKNAEAQTKTQASGSNLPDAAGNELGGDVAPRSASLSAGPGSLLNVRA